ncbi:MAG TPA: HD domain-containing phosphohydrolase [Candidatus Omnitrophota bacterium]|nr:HD domain-containing phosphohydrolase [Candidatus Omnitrophota bacterium]
MTQKAEEHTKKLIKLQSIENATIAHQAGIAFFLMALVPIGLMTYMILFHLNPMSRQGYRVDLQWLGVLALASSLVGYWIIRRIASVIKTMARTANQLAEGKVQALQMDMKDQSEEIRSLVKVFNNVNQDLEQQVSKLEQSKAVIQDLLKKIGNVITSEQKEESFLDLIVESMTKAMDAESGVLIMVDEKGEEKHFRKVVAWGKEREKILSMAAQKNSTLNWMSQEKRPLIINHTKEDNGTSQDPSELSYRSLLCIPLRFQSQHRGCAMVLNKKNEQVFTSEDTALLENVASQVAVAAENSRLMESAERSYVETIGALAVAVEERDSYTRGHLERVSKYAVRIAETLNMDIKDIQTLRDAAFLHDVGKVAIEDDVLLKPNQLTPEELKVMQSHAEKGEKIIAPLSSFKNLREIIRHHHEYYDGSGYPDGVKGNEISLSARILSIVDTYDALTTGRPYRKALSQEEAIKIIEAGSGTHFDPQIVKVFLQIIKQASSQGPDNTVFK